MEKKYISKEISWLYFNERVLQEAEDPSVDILDRVKFLGIFSSNLDEFFRVRVATLNRLNSLGKKSLQLIHEDPKEELEEIQKYVLDLAVRFDNDYQNIIESLKINNIHIIGQDQLTPEQRVFVDDYFHRV